MNTAKLKGDMKSEVVFKEQVSALSSSLQRNCAKLTSRYSGEYKEKKLQQTNGATDVTVHGKTWESRNLPAVDKALSPQRTRYHADFVHEFKASKEIKSLNEERNLYMSKIEATRGIMNRIRRTTLDGITGKTENILQMTCSGQRVGLAEPVCFNSRLGHNNQESSTDGSTSAVKRLSSNETINRQSSESHSIVLNKLYSSLKKIKSRRGEFRFGEAVGEAQSIFPPNSNRNFAKREEYVLLGGRSKPIRVEMNALDLNLLEQEFSLQLKARSYSSRDEVDLMLVQQFREKYRNIKKTNGGDFAVKSNCRVDIPWARHIVRERKKSDFRSAVDLDSGKTLSIHVYLPNLVPVNETGHGVVQNPRTKTVEHEAESEKNGCYDDAVMQLN